MKSFFAKTFSLVAITASMTSHALTNADYTKLFEGYHACFILFDVNNNKIVSEYNPDNRCNKRLAPDSTFKIPLSLMAFDQGTINQKAVFKWDGQKGILPKHDQDQTPATWLQYSVLWVSQQLTPQLGEERIKHYLADFNYGNQDFSGDVSKNNGLTHAWLSSSLQISGVEQLNFLKAMLNKELPVSSLAVKDTKDNLYLGKLDNGAAYYGKTGSGRNGRNERLAHPSQLRDGWFIGFIEEGTQRYIFISNLTDKKVQAKINPANDNLTPFGSQLLKPITMQILNSYFAKQA